MDTFHWVLATLSMILGLGMTRLLVQAVGLFRSRDRAHLDWVPITWATCIFYTLLQFSWALQELPELVPTWTFQRFLMLFGMAFILFASAALVLPPGELHEGDSLISTFRRDGRWALVLLSLYSFFSLFLNVMFWQIPIASRLGVMNVLCTLLPLGAVFLPNPRTRSAATVLFALVCIVDACMEPSTVTWGHK